SNLSEDGLLDLVPCEISVSDNEAPLHGDTARVLQDAQAPCGSVLGVILHIGANGSGKNLPESVNDHTLGQPSHNLQDTDMSTSVTASELSSRQQCLDDLDEFISSCQQRITDMLDMFGWTPEHFMQPSMLSTCPHNSDHRMPPSALDKHTLVCELTNQGYTRTDAEKILEDRSYFYKDAACVYPVTLVFYGYPRVPQTSEEEQIMLPREDRAALAEYVVLRARAANRLKEVGRDELLVSENLADLIKKETGEGRHLDPVEEMAALRDYRRRRKTYRAKNVHITKKSHTEIMREVINNQMDMYSQSLQDDRSVDRAKKKHKKNKHKSKGDKEEQPDK
ncbi:SNR48-like protein, partial [Mya arenaria]